MSKKDKTIYIALTNREYKGHAGYNVEGASFDKDKIQKVFNEWKQDRIDEFNNEIRENDNIDLINEPYLFRYNDNNKYFIIGAIEDCPCTKEVEQSKEAFVAVIAGLSDGNEVENFKMYASEKSAINWMKNEIFAIKKEWEDTFKRDLSWDLEERRDSLDLESDEVSCSVFGFVKKIEIL